MENQSRQQPATPEEVWATLDRITEKQDRAALEMEKQRKEADRRQEEIDRLEKEADQRMKKLEELFISEWDKLMESLVDRDLLPLLPLAVGGVGPA